MTQLLMMVMAIMMKKHANDTKNEKKKIMKKTYKIIKNTKNKI